MPISWSKNGFIAYSGDSTHNVHMSYLENSDGRSWQLARPQKMCVRPENGPVPEVAFLAWSNLSTDLAIADEHGNFYVMLAGVGLLDKKPDTDSPSYELTSYNHMELIYRDIVEEESRIVALKWLDIEKPHIMNTPAKKAPGSKEYTYSVSQHQPHGVTHPIPTKQAVFVLRENGVLDLFYQGEHKVEYHKLGTRLDENVLFSHSSIGFGNDKRALVVAYDSISRRILVYTVQIEWGFLLESARKQKADPHYHTPMDQQTPPSLTITRVQALAPLPRYVDNETRVLSRIDVVSASGEPDAKPDVFLAYTVGSSTLLQRYRLEDEPVAEAFVDLGVRKNAEGGGEKPQALGFQDSLRRSGVLKYVSLVAETCIVCLFGDRIDLIDRTDMKVDKSGDESISTFFDVGFVMPAIPSPIFAISPNLALGVYLKDGLHVVVAENKSPSALVPIAFGFRHAYSCYTNTCSDDLVILIEKELARDTSSALVESLMTEAHRAINFQLDVFNKESVDKLLSNLPLQKLLSLQLALGDVSGNTKMADIAWVVLNMRSASFGIMFSLSSIYRQMSKKKPAEDTMQDSSARAECVVSLLGNIKWLIDLMAYLNQELIQLSIEKKNPGQGKLTMTNSLVLPLILSKVPRLFLIYALSSINKTRDILKKLHKDLMDANKLFSPMKESIGRCFTILNNSPLTLALFENYLKECDALVQREVASRFAYKEKGHGLLNEQKLVCCGELSEDMLQVAHVLVDRHAVSINRDLKVSDLYFYDTSWLMVGVNKRVEGNHNAGVVSEGLPVLPRNGSDVDCLRKVLVNGGVVRRCTRCRSVSLLSDPVVFDGRSGGLWTMVFQRTCVCGNPWTTE